MRVGSLLRLVETARALPGERRPLAGSFIAVVAAAPATAEGEKAASADAATEVDAQAIAALRRRLGRLLGELSRRLEPALIGALVRAETAWDQFDAFAVLDGPLAGEGEALRSAAARLVAMQQAPLRAAGMEMLLALDGALGLLSLVERRLATLVRLRIRSADPALLPGGRPFIDVAAALAEAARAWA